MTDSNGENSGRDSQCRFQTGNTGGPGNPQVRQLAAHQAVVREALTPGELQAVLRKLRDQAMAGDVAAAKVVLDRVVGKSRPEPARPPLQQLEPRPQERLVPNHTLAAVAGADAKGVRLGINHPGLVVEGQTCQRRIVRER